MDKEKVVKKVIFFVKIIIGLLLLWFLIINPFIKFKNNESKMLKASKRYFEVNSNELPTGNRVKTISLKDLYSKAFLEEDLYIPFSSKACSVTESWVKVRQVDGDYKYYVYLKCGVVKSIVDSKGPEIKLNGEDEIVVNRGDKYKELGVLSVKDNKDGTMSTSDVKINSKDVDMKKNGTYEVTYTATDSLNNKTVKVRKVKVVSRLKKVVNDATNGDGYYKGINVDNYIKFSGMLFRIVGVDGDNVKIIADKDISNVNYSGLDKWLDYYYDHLTNKAKEYIVENKYCNMKINETDIQNTTKCKSYTGKKKVYVISATEINKSADEETVSFLRPSTLSWVGEKNDNKNGYATRDVFYDKDLSIKYLKFSKNYNYGVRPVITIKGSSLIKSGNGTLKKPYSLGEFKSGKSGDKLNTRYSGEYVKYAGYKWRIIEKANDGTTKVICDSTLQDELGQFMTGYDTNNGVAIYNPTKKYNAGYSIKNKSSKYMDTKYFDKKEISVPIYKDLINYNKEVETKKYKVKVSAPNTYEMFSAFPFGDSGSYLYLNSSKSVGRISAVMDIGYMINEKVGVSAEYGVRPVGYLNKKINIVNGDGTEDNPYVISK